MMSEDEQSIDDFFPKTETYPDFAGRKHTFVIALLELPSGYFLRAQEEPDSDLDDGYMFAAYSPTDPFFALGLLRDRIRRGLATRYLLSEGGRRRLSHDRAKGRIGSGGVVIDGKFVSFDEFSVMLQSYEGFSFSLAIQDIYDAE